MDEIIKFLNENNVGALATSKNNRPYVRPHHVQLIKDGKFYFSSANIKKIYKQLQDNPCIEFSATSKDFVTVRLSGEIKFTDNIKVKELLINNCPLVKKGYQTANNPIFEVFYLEHGRAIMSDFSGKPPREYNF